MTEEDEEFARIERESAMRQEPARTTMLADQPAQKRPQNCGTSYCSCIECVMEPANQLDDINVVDKPAQQEPVAWRWSESGGVRWFDWTTDWSHYDRAKAMGFPIQYAAPQPAQQEPVAMTFDEAYSSLNWQDWRMRPTKELLAELHRLTSPPQRTWVGLTDDERLEVAEIDGADEWFWKVCKAIEAKLKELNQ